MFCVRRRCPSAPVKKPARRPPSPSRSLTAQWARVSIRRHWLKTTTFRPCSSTICRTSWRSSNSLGANRLLSTLSSGARPRIVGHISSKSSWARPLEMIR